MLPGPIQNSVIGAYRIYRNPKPSQSQTETRELLLRNRNADISYFDQYQLARLREIVAHAWSQSDGYRDYWEQHGFRPEQIETLSDIKRIPVITKEIIARNVDYFSIRKRSRNATYITSSGSTGVPVGLYIDDYTKGVDRAFRNDMLSLFGYKPGDRSVVIRGASIGGGYNGSPHVERALEGYLQISSYTLRAENIPDYVMALDKFSPTFIYAYPSSIALLTSLFVKAGVPPPCKLKFVFCSSENLYKGQRTLIEDYWGCTVVNLYGSVERVGCAVNFGGGDRLFAYPEYGITEILDEKGNDAGPGQSGVVVGTSLFMKQTPFIRYRLDDLAVREEDRFVEGQRSNFGIREIVGREKSFSREKSFIRRKNREAVPFARGLHDDYFTEFDQFQFRQTDFDRIEFRYVSDRIVNESVLARLKQDIIDKIGAEFVLECNRVDRIERGPNGKYSYFVGLD